MIITDFIKEYGVFVSALIALSIPFIYQFYIPWLKRPKIDISKIEIFNGCLFKGPLRDTKWIFLRISNNGKNTCKGLEARIIDLKYEDGISYKNFRPHNLFWRGIILKNLLILIKVVGKFSNYLIL